MRPDMHKVINEPARACSKDHYKKANPYKNTPFEDLPQKESMKIKYGWDTRSKRSNIRPLEKWLLKQVGRPWNDVYSEACKVLKDKHDKHGYGDLIQELFWVVERDVIMIDNVPHSIRLGSFAPIGRWRNQLYINPDNGKLEIFKAAKYVKPTKPATRYEFVNTTTPPKGAPKPSALHGKPESWFEGIEQINGIWYFTKGYHYAVYHMTYKWKKDDLNHVYYKRQLNKKELKKYKVSNIPIEMLEAAADSH